MKEFHIKALKKKDLNSLLILLKEFADYEKKCLQTNKKKLNDLFFKNDFGRAFILRENQEIIGYLMFFYTFSSFRGCRGIYIEDIYIKKNFRRKGYGRQIFKFLAELCQKENIQKLTWVCLNENTLGINFYQGLNARHMDELRTYCLEGEDLAKICKL
ncbi:GNAT family N-acetyltransferase [Campylobacter sp.]|uniref:GNAT family N-acetyltransferase n=1 Tax=Campylobacter sp. TaxID=205 RepID=UPI0026DC2744|nr:GNAT family N-acetyltransferase [Campylobacter sp.]MDO4674138.1 GNAT family N-acetyltransferase [Campylobacter sp.]